MRSPLADELSFAWLRQRRLTLRVPPVPRRGGAAPRNEVNVEVNVKESSRTLQSL
jgi:hypothetical protein